MARINGKAKQVWITRTIKSTIADIKCYNNETDEMETIKRAFEGTLEDERILFLVTDSERKGLKVIEKEYREMKRKIKFEDFMRFSIPCDGTEDDDN